MGMKSLAMCGSSDLVIRQKSTGREKANRTPRVGKERDVTFAIGAFPKPVSLGGRAVGWLEAEVQHWLQGRIEASRNESSGVMATLETAWIFELKNNATYRYLE